MPDEERDYAAELEAALWEEDFALAHKIVTEAKEAEGEDESLHKIKKAAIREIMQCFHRGKYETVQTQIPTLADDNADSEDTPGKAKGQAGLVTGDRLNAIVEIDGKLVKARIARPGYHFHTIREGRILVFSDAGGYGITPATALKQGIARTVGSEQ